MNHGEKLCHCKELARQMTIIDVVLKGTYYIQEHEFL